MIANDEMIYEKEFSPVFELEPFQNEHAQPKLLELKIDNWDFSPNVLLFD